jgi:hypothetical protein
MSSYRAKHDKNNNVAERAYRAKYDGLGLIYKSIFIPMPRIDPRDRNDSESIPRGRLLWMLCSNPEPRGPTILGKSSDIFEPAYPQAPTARNVTWRLWKTRIRVTEVRTA